MTGADKYDTFRNRPLGPVLATILLSVLAAGCGGGPAKPSYPSARLEGTVKVEGELLRTGTVQFVPPQGSTASVIEAPIKDGRYIAEKVPVGKVRVLFTAVRETGRADTKSTSQPVPEVVNIIPDRYRDGLEIEVKADSSSQNFDLKSR
jgi:hypothetical protein